MAETHRTEHNISADQTSDQTSDQSSDHASQAPRLPIPAPRPEDLAHHKELIYSLRHTEPRREIEPRIARMEAEMEHARSRGVLGLMRLRYEA